MAKKKILYFHTIDDEPATYIKDEQICFLGNSSLKLSDGRKILYQIRKEQKLSGKWRRERGFDACLGDYGYFKLKIS